MMSGEEVRQQAMAEIEKKQRYNDAVDTILSKKSELGHMPTERELKQDPTIDIEQLIKDLDKKNFSGAIIEVLREQRRREGQPDRILPRYMSKREMRRLKVTNPEEYEKEVALREEKKEEEKERKRRAGWRMTEEKRAKEEETERKRKEFRKKMVGDVELSAVTKKPEEVKVVSSVKKPRWSKEQIAKAIWGIYQDKGEIPPQCKWSFGNGVPSYNTIAKHFGYDRSKWLEACKQYLYHGPEPATDATPSQSVPDEEVKQILRETSGSEEVCVRKEFVYVDEEAFANAMSFARDIALKFAEVPQVESGISFNISVSTKVGKLKMYFIAEMDREE